jgi:outer membrane protein assembly factor BamD (BamD/ComL family)
MIKTALLIAILALVVPGCSDRKASELYDTAKFEELQNNKEHAVQLYERIIVVYPSSEYAAKARERVDALKNK